MNQFIYKQASDMTALSARFQSFSYKKHAHEEYALGVTMQGIQKFTSKGSVQASCPHGVILFNPGQFHDGWAHDQKTLDYVMIYITEDKMKAILQMKEMFAFKDSVVYDKALERLVYNTAFTILNGCDEAVSDELLIELGDHLQGVADKQVIPSDHNRVEIVKDMLRETGCDILKLEDVAAEVDLSKYQLIRFFKSQMGISPYQYHLNCRLERAKKLIEETKEAYTAVAMENFVDISHLNRHFKRVYGVTANAYAKAIV